MSGSAQESGDVLCPDEYAYDADVSVPATDHSDAEKNHTTKVFLSQDMKHGNIPLSGDVYHPECGNGILRNRNPQ